MNTNDFDKIAPYYDRLARFVFRDSIRKAQQIFKINKMYFGKSSYFG